jgi:hypothetical protein
MIASLYVDHGSVELKILTYWPPQELGLQACATVPNMGMQFDYVKPSETQDTLLS